MCMAPKGLTVRRTFQRESGRCELSGAGRVLTQSHRRNAAYSALRSKRKEQYALLNLGGTTRAFVPFGGGAFFVLIQKYVSKLISAIIVLCQLIMH